jgi:hypothetical protein
MTVLYTELEKIATDSMIASFGRIWPAVPTQREQLRKIAATRRELRDVRASMPKELRHLFITRVRRPSIRDMNFNLSI